MRIEIYNLIWICIGLLALLTLIFIIRNSNETWRMLVFETQPTSSELKINNKGGL